MKADTIFSLSIGDSIEWKFGLVTREIYRIDKNHYEIADTSDGWVSAVVTQEQMAWLLDGSVSLSQITFN